MAGKIKGITIEIGGDTSGLNKALSSAKKEANAIQKELKEVDKALKLDPTNIDLLRQRQELLNKQITASENKVEALKKAKDNADKAMADGTQVNQDEYRKLVRELSLSESSLKDLKKQGEITNKAIEEGTYDVIQKEEQLAKSTKKVSSETSNSGKIAEGAKKGFTVLKGAMANLVAQGINKVISGIKNLGQKFVELGVKADDLNTLSKQSGFSTEEIQKFDYAAERIDVDTNDIIGANKKMLKNMSSTSKDTVAAFERIGVATTDSNGKLRDRTTVFNEVLQGLSKIADETERDQLAMQIFGKSADQLAGIIDDGGKALNEYGKEAENAGLIMSQNTLDSANKFNDAIDTMKAQTSGVFTQIGGEIATELAPRIEEVANQVTEFLNSEEGKAAMRNIADIISNIIQLAIEIVNFVVENKEIVISVITGITAAMVAWKIAQFALNASMYACPIVWIIAAIGGLVAAIVAIAYNWDEVKNACIIDWNAIKSAISSAWDWMKGIGASIGSFFSGVWENVKNVFKSGANFVIGISNGIIGAAESVVNGVISGVNFGIGMINKMLGGIESMLEYVGIDVNLKIPDISKVSIPRVPYLWAGGTVENGGQAIVGEKGAELLTVNNGKAQVTPLNNINRSSVNADGINVNIGTFNNYDTEVDTNTLAETVAYKIDLKTRRVARANG